MKVEINSIDSKCPFLDSEYEICNMIWYFSDGENRVECGLADNKGFPDDCPLKKYPILISIGKKKLNDPA